MALLPGAGPACGHVFGDPGEADRSSGNLQLAEGIASGVVAAIGREREVLNRNLNAEGRAKAPSVEFAMAFLKALGKVLAEVLHEAELAILAFASGGLNVDIAVADDGAPAGAE